MKKAIFTKSNKKTTDTSQETSFDMGICPTIEIKNGSKYYRGYFIPENLISIEVSSLFSWVFPEGECNVHTDVTKPCGKQSSLDCQKCIVRKENKIVFQNYRRDIRWNPKIGEAVWKIRFNPNTRRWTSFKGTCNEANLVMGIYSSVFRTREQARIACNRLHDIMCTPNGKLIANMLWSKKNL